MMPNGRSPGLWRESYSAVVACRPGHYIDPVTISRALAWVLLLLTLVGASLIRQLHGFIPDWTPLPWPIRSPLYAFLVILFLMVATGTRRRAAVGGADTGRRIPIALLARSVSRRWTRYTRLANLVRYVASSIALSPPPTTTNGLLRNIGKAPSQTAHAETPRFLKRSSDSRPK